MADVPNVMQVVGYANTGKTTLITHLIRHFRKQGLQVGVIKRDGHDQEWEQAGKDTWRFRATGASLVAIQSATKMAWFEQPPPSLDVLIERMKAGGAQIILVEGFKSAPYPKLLVVREPSQLTLLDELDDCRGIVSWQPLPAQQLPVYAIDQPQHVAAFVEAVLFGEEKNGYESI